MMSWKSRLAVLLSAAAVAVAGVAVHSTHSTAPLAGHSLDAVTPPAPSSGTTLADAAPVDPTLGADQSQPTMQPMGHSID